eukprot:jgi/Mesen1/2501/ME000159S01623
MDSAMSIRDQTFIVDLEGPGAARLRQAVKEKLADFMGSYTDDVLAEYVVVLVGHGKQYSQTTADLEAFLGDNTDSFVDWLWGHLAANKHLYVKKDVLEADGPQKVGQDESSKHKYDNRMDEDMEQPNVDVDGHQDKSRGGAFRLHPPRAVQAAEDGRVEEMVSRKDGRRSEGGQHHAVSNHDRSSGRPTHRSGRDAEAGGRAEADRQPLRRPWISGRERERERERERQHGPDKGRDRGHGQSDGPFSRERAAEGRHRRRSEERESAHEVRVRGDTRGLAMPRASEGSHEK